MTSKLTSKKYASLDMALLSGMNNIPTPFNRLFTDNVEAECKIIASEEGNDKEPFRILDRRLQALRKKGIIESTTKGWVKYD